MIGDNGAQFSVVVTNGQGSTTSASAPLTVTASSVGVFISTQPLGQSVHSGATVTFSVQAGGTGPFTYQWYRSGVLIPGMTYYALTISPVTAAYSGAAYSVIIKSADGSAATSNDAILKVIINTAPQAVADSVSTSIGTPVTKDVLANDSDADGDPLSVSAVGSPAHGSAVGNVDNTITYTPVPNYVGNDSFTYTANDGQGGTAQTTCTVTVIDTLQATSPGTATFNAGTGYYEQTVTVTNSGAIATGGFQLRLTNVPEGITVVGGIFDAGSNSWIVGFLPILGPGQNVAVVLQYSASGNPGSFTPSVAILPPPAVIPPPDSNFNKAANLLAFDNVTGNVTLRFIVVAGRVYEFDYSQDFQSWPTALGGVSARNNVMQWTDDGSLTGGPAANVQKRFYRLKDVTP